MYDSDCVLTMFLDIGLIFIISILFAPSLLASFCIQNSVLVLEFLLTLFPENSLD